MIETIFMTFLAVVGILGMLVMIFGMMSILHGIWKMRQWWIALYTFSLLLLLQDT